MGGFCLWLRILECGDLSPLWSVASCRDLVALESTRSCSVKPPDTKAATGRRTAKVFLESESLSLFPKTKKKYFVPVDVSNARRRQQPPGVGLLPEPTSRRSRPTALQPRCQAQTCQVPSGIPPLIRRTFSLILSQWQRRYYRQHCMPVRTVSSEIFSARSLWLTPTARRLFLNQPRWCCWARDWQALLPKFASGEKQKPESDKL